MKIYLAGPITGLTYGASEGWRQYVKACLGNTGIKCFSPLRAQEWLRDNGVLTESSIETNVMTSADGIMVRDHWDVQTCDLVFVNFLGAKRISIGTVMELGFAYAHRKPVVMAIEPDNVHKHAMVDKAGVFQTADLNEAIELTKAILLPN